MTEIMHCSSDTMILLHAGTTYSRVLQAAHLCMGMGMLPLMLAASNDSMGYRTLCTVSENMV